MKLASVIMFAFILNAIGLAKPAVAAGVLAGASKINEAPRRCRLTLL